MSWFGDSLSSLKGQLTNLTQEVLNAGAEEGRNFQAEYEVAVERIKELETLCKKQDQNIFILEEEKQELRSCLTAKELCFREKCEELSKSLLQTTNELSILHQGSDDNSSKEVAHNVELVQERLLALVGDFKLEKEEIGDEIQATKLINSKLNNACSSSEVCNKNDKDFEASDDNIYKIKDEQLLSQRLQKNEQQLKMKLDKLEEDNRSLKKQLLEWEENIEEETKALREQLFDREKDKELEELKEELYNSKNREKLLEKQLLDKNNSSIEVINTMEEENSRLKQEISSREYNRQEQVEELTVQITELQKEKEELQRSQDNTTDIIEKMKEENSRLKQEISGKDYEKQEQVEELTTQITELQKEKEELQRNLMNNKDNTVEIVEKMKEENSRLRQEVSSKDYEKQEQVEELTTQITGLQKEKEELQKNLMNNKDGITEIIEKMKEENSRLKQQISSKECEIQEQVEELTTQITDLQKEKEELQRNLMNSQDSTTKIIEKMEEENSRLKQEISSKDYEKQEQAEELTIQITELQKEKEELQKSLINHKDTTTEETEKMEEENFKLKQEIADRDASRETEHLRQQLKEIQKQKEELQNTLVKNEDNANEVISTIQEENSRLKQEIDERQDEIEELTEQITEIQKEKEELEESSKENISRVNLEEQVRNLQNEIANFRGKLSELSEEAVALRNENNELNSKLDSRNESLAQKNKDIKFYVDEIANQEERYNEVIKENQEADIKIRSLSAQIETDNKERMEEMEKFKAVEEEKINLEKEIYNYKHEEDNIRKEANDVHQEEEAQFKKEIENLTQENLRLTQELSKQEQREKELTENQKHDDEITKDTHYERNMRKMEQDISLAISEKEKLEELLKHERDALDNISAELQILKQDLETREKLLEEKSQRIVMLECSQQESQEKESRVREELKQSLSDLTTEHEESLQRQEGLKQQIAAQAMIMEKQQQQIMCKEKEAEEQIIQIQEQQERLDCYQDHVRVSEESQNKLQQVIDSLKKQIDNQVAFIEEQKEEIQRQKQQLQDQHHQFQQQINNQSQHHQDQFSEQRQSIDVLKQQIVNLEQSCVKHVKDLQTKTSEVDQKDQQLEKQNEEILKLTMSDSSLQQQYSMLQQQYSTLHQQYSMQHQQCSTLQQQCSSLQQSVENLREEKEMQVSGLQIEVSSLRNSENEILELLNVTKEENRVLKEQLEEIHSESATLKELLLEYRKFESMLTQELSLLNLEIESVIRESKSNALREFTLPVLADTNAHSQIVDFVKCVKEFIDILSIETHKSQNIEQELLKFLVTSFTHLFHDSDISLLESVKILVKDYMDLKSEAETAENSYLIELKRLEEERQNLIQELQQLKSPSDEVVNWPRESVLETITEEEEYQSADYLKKEKDQLNQLRCQTDTEKESRNESEKDVDTKLMSVIETMVETGDSGEVNQLNKEELLYAIREVSNRIRNREKEHVDSMIRSHNEESEGFKSKVDILEMEKKQLIHALQQKHDESVMYHGELQNVQEQLPGLIDREKLLNTELRESKDKLNSANTQIERLRWELMRLREHLIEVEDSHTQDSLAYQQKEAIFHKQIENLKQEVASWQHEASQSKMDTTEQDEASAQLVKLQLVLHAFQNEREQEVNWLKQQHETHCRNFKTEIDSLKQVTVDLQKRLEISKEEGTRASKLDVQLHGKEKIISQLEKAVIDKEKRINEVEKILEQMSNDKSSKVDRELLRNLVVHYFSPGLAALQKTDILRVMARVLELNEEDRKKLGVGSKEEGTKWIPQWLRPSPNPTPDTSLTKAFVEFLEQESRPRPSLTLPPEPPSPDYKSLGGRVNEEETSRMSVQLPSFSSPQHLHDLLSDTS